MINFKKSFYSILNGYHTFRANERYFFVKHLSYIEEKIILDQYDDFFQKAKEKGLPNREELLKELIEKGDWSQEKEDNIKYYQNTIENMQKERDQQVYKSKMDKIKEGLKNLNAQLKELVRERDSVLKEPHCEKNASEFANSFFISLTIFEDENFMKPVFNDAGIDLRRNEESDYIVSAFNKSCESFSESTIQKIAVSDFFKSVFYLCKDDIYHFYGKPISRLSFNQIKLANWGLIFKNINQRNDNIPDEISENPEELLDLDVRRKNEEKNQSHRTSKKSNDNTKMTFKMGGATKEDLLEHGQEVSDAHSIISQMAKENKRIGQVF